MTRRHRPPGRPQQRSRQRQSTGDLIFTPVEMLRHIQAEHPDRRLHASDIVLTGTPGGVVMSAPRWTCRLAALLGMDRLALLRATIRQKAPQFL